jgi:hypothetical protein
MVIRFVSLFNDFISSSYYKESNNRMIDGCCVRKDVCRRKWPKRSLNQYSSTCLESEKKITKKSIRPVGLRADVDMGRHFLLLNLKHFRKWGELNAVNTECFIQGLLNFGCYYISYFN